MSDPLSALRAVSGNDPSTGGSTDLPNIPAVPASEDNGLVNLLSSMKAWMEKAAGSGLTGFATKRELMSAGVLQKDENGNLIGVGGVPDMTIPPVPTGLAASGAMTNILVQWDNPFGAYSNHGYTEIWAAGTDNFSAAVMVAQSWGFIFSHAVGEDSVRFYWVRFVSLSGVKGPFNSVNGVRGETAKNPEYLLQTLNKQISESELANTLNTRINLIDGDASVPGSVSYRVAQETTARANADETLAQSLLTVQAVAARGANIAKLDWWAIGAALPDGWSYNGAASENTFITGTDQTGITSTLWSMVAGAGGAVAGQDDGGWNGGQYLNAIDRTKTYRFVIPVIRYTSASGTQYWGIEQSSVCDLNTGNANGNPYFCAAALPKTNTWYYMVGYVFPAGSTGNTHANAGLYEASTGTLIAGGTNYCWHATNGSGAFRAYQYYAQSGAQSAFAKPMVHRVDGSEPPLEGLLQNKAALQVLAKTVAGPDGATAQYTVKTDVNGYVSGFGLSNTYNNASPYSQFVFKADQFAFGAPGLASVYPFVIQTSDTIVNGVSIPAGVYIDAAYIKNGTITNAKIGAAAIDSAKIADAAITNAKIADLDASKINAGTISANRIGANSLTAEKIDSRGLTIKDSAGNIILGAGTALNVVNISGLGSLATQNTVAYASLTGAKPPADADKTSNNIAAGFSGQGAFATLNAITAANISSYIASGAIGRAYIGAAAIGYAQIGDAEIGTLKVAGNAITVASGASGSQPSVTLTTYGGPVFVCLSANRFCTLTRNGAAIADPYYITVDGSGAMSVLTMVDYPGAGTFTYQIYGPRSAFFGAVNGHIFALECKR